MTTMANSCRLCRTDVPDESTGQVCRDCAHAAASYVLERPAREVELFWDVDETFGNRREHFLRLAPRRRDSGAETYGGLAIGYLSIGLRTDAALAAALGIRDQPDKSDCCWDPAVVLFDDRLLRVELMDQLASTLKHLDHKGAGGRSK